MFGFDQNWLKPEWFQAFALFSLVGIQSSWTMLSQFSFLSLMFSLNRKQPE